MSICDYYNNGQCRSCNWIEKSIDEQVQLKEQSLVRQMHAAMSALPQLEPTIRSTTLKFRNRAKMMVTGSVDAPVIGLVGENELDHGRELLNCPIHHPALNQLINLMPKYIKKYQLIPYQIKERKGELKGFIATYSPKSNQMVLRFVLRSRECVSRILKMIPEFQKEFPELVCISVNLQPIPHAILEGPEEIILTEKKSIDHVIGDRLGPLTLQLTPRAFVQTNFQVATQLYEIAAAWIQESKSARMVDLFCGQGAFGFMAALQNKNQEVLGVEINADAVKSAQETALQMNFKNIHFECCDATQSETLITRIQSFKPDLILANPPRRGLTTGIELIEKLKPQHFFYSSCNVETLSTDLQKISSLYKIKKIQLFDMFPHTEHFETLVWLELI